MANLSQTLKQMKESIKVLGSSFVRENLLLRASSLTLTSLVNMVPLMVVIFSIFSAFPFLERLSLKFQSFMFKNYVPSSGDVIREYLQTFEKHSQSLSWMAFIFLFLTVGILMVNIEVHLNAIFRLKQKRHFYNLILLYCGMLIVAPILLGFGLVLSSYLTSLVLFSDEMFMGMRKLLIFLPALSAFLAFLFLYLTVPNAKIRLKHGIVGAFVAMSLFEVARLIFAEYLKYFSSYTLLYGALAAIPVFMIWVYFSWVIFLAGALVTAHLSR